MISVGSTVGNYRIVRRLGAGAMATVFLAEHPRISKRVAVKVIHTELANSPEMVSRFLAEARAASQIGHENIVDILDFGQTPQGDNFMIMEYLEGQTLTARVRAVGKFSVAVAQKVGTQIADALTVAHQQGVIHRDLKPDNIYIIKRQTNPDYVKILDFGLAKLLIGSEGLNHKTSSGSVLGTPHYMAPEQCEGRLNVDGRADLYSVGCVLYFMVTGELPFPGDGFAEVILKHISEPPPNPRSINPAISPAMEKIILHCLAKNRDYRFQTAEELSRALQDPEKWSQEIGDDPARISGPTGGGRRPAAAPAVGAAPPAASPLSSIAASSQIAAPRPAPVARQSGVGSGPAAKAVASPAGGMGGGAVSPPAAAAAPPASGPPGMGPPPMGPPPMGPPPMGAPVVRAGAAAVSQVAEIPVVANRAAPQMATMIGEMPAAALSALMKPPPPGGAGSAAGPPPGAPRPAPPAPEVPVPTPLAASSGPVSSAPAAMTQLGASAPQLSPVSALAASSNPNVLPPSAVTPPSSAYASQQAVAPVASASQPSSSGYAQPQAGYSMAAQPQPAFAPGPTAGGASSAPRPQAPLTTAVRVGPAINVQHVLTTLLGRLASQPWAQKFMALPPDRRLLILRGVAGGVGALVLLLLVILLWPGPRVVVVRSTPDQAEVLRGDVSLGTTPLVVEVPRGESLTLSLRKEGFDEAKQEISGKSEKVVWVKLPEQAPSKPIPEKKPVTKPAPDDDGGEDGDGGGATSDDSKKKKKKKKKKVVVF